MSSFRLPVAILFLLVPSVDVADGQSSEADVDVVRRTMVARIDRLVSQRWEAAGVEPADPAPESEFLRRVTLDLTGVIPRASEVRQFLANDHPDKRTRLVDALLLSPRHATHMANTWRNRLVPHSAEIADVRQVLGVQNWLRDQFADNIRFDRIVADLLVATDGSEMGPALYFLSHDLAPEKLAASTAELFLGVRLHCAQCHDHPYAEWTQQDFWGYAAFFARVQSPPQMDMQQGVYRLIDASAGEVSLPDTRQVIPPKYLAGRAADAAEGGTRRLQLSIWMASRDNPYLARAMANWAWSHLFGQGLIEPLGDAGTHNPPSHPQLLDELARYVIEIEFDLHKLWQTLTSTQAYQLSSDWGDKTPAPRELFASMNVKSLTPEQLYDSFTRAAPAARGVIAGNNPRATLLGTDALLDPERVDFLRRMKSPSESPREYSAGIMQALMLMNGSLMSRVTSPASSDLLAALEAPIYTDDDRIDALFLSTVSRFPHDEERLECGQYMSSGTAADDRRRAESDILWSLINSTEFTFNH